jgi:uncharacterized membrane protein
MSVTGAQPATAPDAAGGPAEAPAEAPRSSLAAQCVVVAAATVYTLLLVRWTFRNHDAFATYGFDLGIYDHGLWLLSRFHAPFVTIMGRNLFGDHTSFILLPFVPLWWIVPGAKTLLFLQTAAMASAVVPIFLIARDRLRDEWAAALLAAAFVAQPAVAWLNLEQFHPDCFEVPALLFACWFALRRRWVGYFVCLALFLAVKEDAPLVAFALGVYIGFRIDRRVGIVTCAVSALYLASAMWVILPALNDVGSLNGWRLPFGGPGGVVRTTFTHPAEMVRYLRSDDRPFYVWQLVSPFALLPLLAPSALLVALVPIGLNIVSNFWYQYHLQYHYTATIPPLLMIATIIAISRVPSRGLRLGACGVVLASSLFTGWFWGPATFARNPVAVGDPSYPGFATWRYAVSLVPDDAVVSAQYRFVTHLEHRREIYEFPVPWKARNWGTFRDEGKVLPSRAARVEWVVVPVPIPDPGEQAVVDQYVKPAFREVYRADNVLVLRRR